MAFSELGPVCPHLSHHNEPSTGHSSPDVVKVEGSSTLPSLLSCGLQDAARPLLQKDTLPFLAHDQLLPLQNPQILFCKATFGQLAPSM